MKRKGLVLVALLLMATITVGAYYARRTSTLPALVTAPVTRGEIVNVISATGTVDAVTTVEVGSQVTGTIQSLGADFNQIVRKGQVIARLDPSIYETALDQVQSALASAEADAERYRVAQSAADTALTRAHELFAKSLLPPSDLQTAETDSRSAAAQVASAAARIRQARSAVDTARLNLSKTIILSPIDGVVISRSVDVGQTVSASVSAPTLFVIAADLSKMQLEASIDESDLGNVKEGQLVSFHVDAYPTQTFAGKVLQVRLNPTTVSNVVTYTAIIDAPNPELKLKPGMTATVTIEVARRDDVLRVPTSALRFKPGADVLGRFGGKAAATSATASGTSNTVWVSDGTTITPVPVTIGASDGTRTEILGAPFAEGTLVVTRAATTATSSPAPAATTGNPLMPGRPPGGPRPPGM